MIKRTVQQAFGDEAGRMRHIAHDKSAYFIGNLTDTGIIPVAAVGGGAANDHLGLFRPRYFLHHVIINPSVLFFHTIEYGTIQLAGEIHG